MLFFFNYNANSSIFFFFNDTATTEIYTLSLHDALPISFSEFGFPKSHAAAFGLLAYQSASSPKDRKSTRLNSSHSQISYAVFCLKKKKTRHKNYVLYYTTSKARHLNTSTHRQASY